MPARCQVVVTPKGGETRPRATTVKTTTLIEPYTPCTASFRMINPFIYELADHANCGDGVSAEAVAWQFDSSTPCSLFLIQFGAETWGLCP